MTKFVKNLWKLPRNRITASFLGRESAKRATKSREVPRHIKSDKGLFFESLIIERQKIQEKLQEAVCCRFCQGSVELLENVSSKTGLGSAWLVRCENENCPSQKTKWSFFYNRKDRTEQSLWNKLFICCRISFLTFSYCVTVVFSSLVCINIDSFGVIICYNLVTGNTPSKIFFPCFLEMKIRASWEYVLNSKSATLGPIWQKFGWLTVS